MYCTIAPSTGGGVGGGGGAAQLRDLKWWLKNSCYQIKCNRNVRREFGIPYFQKEYVLQDQSSAVLGSNQVSPDGVAGKGCRAFNTGIWIQHIFNSY